MADHPEIADPVQIKCDKESEISYDENNDLRKVVGYLEDLDYVNLDENKKFTELKPLDGGNYEYDSFCTSASATSTVQKTNYCNTEIDENSDMTAQKKVKVSYTFTFCAK